MTQKEIGALREKYPPGARILLHKMQGEPQMTDGLQGTVGSVDDLGQIHVRWDNGSSLALSSEEDRFEVVSVPEKIRVLLVEPGKYPKSIEIPDTLEAMQGLVGGYIEVYSPFDEEVSIVCNDEGKIRKLPLNRAIYDPDTGELLDIIAGSFFLVGTPEDSDSFQSLTQHQQMRYYIRFSNPERFGQMNGKILVEKYVPERERTER